MPICHWLRCVAITDVALINFSSVTPAYMDWLNGGAYVDWLWGWGRPLKRPLDPRYTFLPAWWRSNPASWTKRFQKLAASWTKRYPESADMAPETGRTAGGRTTSLLRGSACRATIYRHGRQGASRKRKTLSSQTLFAAWKLLYLRPTSPRRRMSSIAAVPQAVPQAPFKPMVTSTGRQLDPILYCQILSQHN